MSISSISSLQKSYFIPSGMIQDQVNTRLQEAMINLDFDMMIELLNQGANPHITTEMTPSLSEKIFNYALEKNYYREFEIRELIEKNEYGCSTNELEIIHALKSNPASVSDEQLKSYLRSVPRIIHCGVINLVEIAFSCLHVSLIQKLDELNLLSSDPASMAELAELFLDKGGLEVLKMLISQGDSLSELLCGGEKGVSAQEIYRIVNCLAFYGLLRYSIFDFYLFLSEIGFDLEDYFEDEARFESHLSSLYIYGEEEKAFYIDFLLDYSSRYFENHKEGQLDLTFYEDDQFTKNKYWLIQTLIAKGISLNTIFNKKNHRCAEYLNNLKTVAQHHGDAEIVNLIEIENKRADFCFSGFRNVTFITEKEYQIIRDRLSKGVPLKDVVSGNGWESTDQRSCVNLIAKAQQLNDIEMINLLEIESHKKENFHLRFNLDSPYVKEDYRFFREHFLHGTQSKDMFSAMETCYQWEIENLKLMAQKLNDQEMLDLLIKTA